MKKRIISSLFTILLLLSFVGCTTETKKKDFSFEEFGITFEGKEVEYDGNPQMIYINGTLPEGIVVTYLGNGKTEVGTYTVVATFADTTNTYKPIPNLTAQLVIKEKSYLEIEGVSFNDKTVTYDGNAHSIEIEGTLPEGVSVEYEGNGKVNAGTYEVTAKFTDTTGLYGNIDPVTATLTINKATYDMSSVVLPGKTVTYDGNAHSLEITGTLPEGVSVSYENNEHTDSGEYEVVANFTHENPNYNSIPPMSATLKIEKLKFDLTGISLEDKTVTYDGNTHYLTLTNSDNLPYGVDSVYENNGQVNAGTYIVTVSFRHDFAEYDVIEPMTATLTINKADYDLSDITFENKEVICTGQAQSIYVTGTLPEGLEVSYEGNEQTEVGEYTVKANFNDTTGNYNNPESMTATLTVIENPFNGVSLSGKTVTYDGNTHSLAITGTLPEGVSVEYENNDQVKAGTYTVKANFVDTTGNYPDVPALEATLVINKADYDMSQVVFANKTVTYTQFIQSLSVENLPAGLEVTYENNENTNVGTYKVKASFNDTTGNYNNPETMEATLTIEQAEYDMSGITFANKEFSYDGTVKSIAISGTLPTGVVVNYTNNDQKEVGIYTVTATFTHSNPNYKEIPAMTATINISNDNVKIVTFVLEGGNVEKVVEVNAALTDIPQIPAKAGYVSYWDYDFSCITENVTLEPVYDLIYYSIEYELDYGIQNAGNPTLYTVETNFTFLAPTKNGYAFLGWYKEAAFTNKVTAITEGQTGNIKLYAKYELDENTCLVVGAGKQYTTIAAAVAAATDGAVIYVMPGTYSDSFTISQKNITIEGPNKGIAGTETRNEEAVITGTVTITGSNTVIDGMALSGSGAIALNGASKTTITNLYSTSEGIKNDETDTTSDTEYAVILSHSNYNASFDLTVSNSYFYSASTTAAYQGIHLFGKMTNLTVTNNKFKNSLPSGTAVLADAVQSYNSDGTIIIRDNVFDFTTDNWSITVGYGTNTASKVVVRDNLFSSTNSVCGVEVRNAPASCVIDYVGNTVENLNGSALNFAYAASGATINVKYNNFSTGTTFKMASIGSTTVTYYGNSYVNGIWSGSSTAYTANTAACDYNSKFTDAQREAAYASDTYYNPTATETYTIVYILNGGVGDEVQSAITGKTVTLYTPERENYHFLGWTTRSASTDYITTYSQTSTENVVLYAHWEEIIVYDVTFNLNGGTAAGAGDDMGTTLGTIVANSYNGTYSDTTAASNIFVFTTSSANINKYQTRIYIAATSTTNLFEVVEIEEVNTAKSVPSNASYVIVIWSGYTGTGDDNFTLSKISAGTKVMASAAPTTASTTPVTFTFGAASAVSGTVTLEVQQDTVLMVPTKSGYIFAGWYDANNVRYTKGSDFTADTTVTAHWILEDEIIGSFETQSWVVAGEQINLEAHYESYANEQIVWVSKTPGIATVSDGIVTGVSEGVATIEAQSPFSDLYNFTFYVTVFNEEPTGVLKLIVDSNNVSPYKVENLVIGSASDAASGGQWGYYADIILGSVSQLFYGGKLSINNTYLHAYDGYGTFSSLGYSVEYVTFHYGADTPYSSTGSLKGGQNLASYGKTQSNLSYHFGTGNDGAWASLDESWAGYHAGSGQAYSGWKASGVYVLDTDPKYPVTTLGSDGYYYINGRKTNTSNTTKSGAKLSEMGFAVEVRNGQYYMPSTFRYDSTYERICTAGGNVNSVAIESSVRKGSDLWLTWHYSAQLCAYLLNKYDLGMNKLVGHNFWSGKWCPQPMLENNLEIWYIFRDMVEKELALLQSYNSYSISLSSSSSYINSYGRVKSLPTMNECIKYTVTYTTGSTTKNVTLSTILPGA